MRRIKWGVSLLRAAPSLWSEIAIEADNLGFESVWISEHLVLPTAFNTSKYPGGKLPIDPSTPIFDPIVRLAQLAAQTERIHFGTYVYQLGLRHPFVSARALTTLDAICPGRIELGVGAGWLREEWEAAQTPFEGRGRRLDEALEVCGRLWSEERVTHRGEFWSFPEVAFEPKPSSPIPVHVGGEGHRSLQRALRHRGWIGMHHDPASVAAVLARLAEVAAQNGADLHALEKTVATHPGPQIDTEAWAQSGVDRVIVAPWRRSAEAVEGLRSFAAAHL